MSTRAYLSRLAEHIADQADQQVEAAAEIIISASESKPFRGWVVACGNGGDAALAGHFCTDLLKFADVAAFSIADQPAYMSMAGNDFGYEMAFSWWIGKVCTRGDVLVCLSTSGMSTNIIKAAQAGREIGMKVVSIAGEKTSGPLQELSDVFIGTAGRGPMMIEDCQHAICHAIARSVAQKKGRMAL